jgi:hypothetical protein
MEVSHKLLLTCGSPNNTFRNTSIAVHAQEGTCEFSFIKQEELMRKSLRIGVLLCLVLVFFAGCSEDNITNVAETGG